MAQNHTFISELTSDPSAFLPIDIWIIEQVGETKGNALIEEANKNLGSSGLDFNAFYAVWLNEFKITHTTHEEGKDDVVITYKTITPEELEFSTNKVNKIINEVKNGNA